MHFVLFGAFGTVCCITTLSSKRAKLVQKFVPRSRVGIFRSEHTDPPHWTLNSCFGVYCTIWMHSGPFSSFTKLDAKWAEVVQKFVPWSRVRIFRNERTHPPHWTQNSCLIVFYTIFVQLAPFGCITKLSAKRANLMKKVRATKSRRNFSQRTQPIHPIRL